MVEATEEDSVITTKRRLRAASGNAEGRVELSEESQEKVNDE
jgi:hypothetical protein